MTSLRIINNLYLNIANIVESTGEQRTRVVYHTRSAQKHLNTRVLRKSFASTSRSLVLILEIGAAVRTLKHLYG